MAAKRGGLGKGLDSLLSVQKKEEETKQIAQDGVLQIALDDIRPNPHQPRTRFIEEDLDDLKQSIVEHGVIQPIIVRKVDNGYEIIAGERRFRASKLAKRDTIPAIIRDVKAEDQAKMALVENLQRKDLNVIEEARGYQRLIEEFSLTQQEMSHAISRSRAYVTNTLRLMELPPDVIAFLEEGLLTAGHGRAILMFEPSVRSKVAKQAVEKQMSVRALEAYSKLPANDEETPQKPVKDIHIEDVERRLTEKLGTRVTLKVGKKKNIMEITFYKESDLEKIIEKLV